MIIINNQIVVEGSPSLSILDAALVGGISLPHSCRVGRCSACRCRLSRGVTIPLIPEIGLTDREVASGWILSCARKAVGDIALETELPVTAKLPKPKIVPCRVAALRLLSADILCVTLRLPPQSAFPYLPGQHVQILGPVGIRRSYSLTRGVMMENMLEIHVRRVIGGLMSRYWFDEARVNDLLRINGPFGTFFLQEAPQEDLIFLATGVGIAPINAMLESLKISGISAHARSVTVVWGNRKPDDFYLELPEVAGDLKYVKVLSRASGDWIGPTGYVQDWLLTARSNFQQCSVYACGSPAMIDDAKHKLLGAGVPSYRFHADAFVGTGVVD